MLTLFILSITFNFLLYFTFNICFHLIYLYPTFAILILNHFKFTKTLSSLFFSMYIYQSSLLLNPLDILKLFSEI